jgi:hypothetical protein
MSSAHFASAQAHYRRVLPSTSLRAAVRHTAVDGTGAGTARFPVIAEFVPESARARS